MHEIDSRGFRYTLAASGMAASLIFLLASMYANFRYGASLARTEMEGYAYGGAAAACDILMATAPFFFFAALRNRNYTQAVAAFFLWATMTSVAAVSALAQTSVNRLDALSHRVTSSNTYADTRTELTEARKQRDKIGVWVKSESTVKAEIERHKAAGNRAWSASSECQEITGKTQREFCAQYQTLVGELATAQMVAKLDARIEALTTKSDKIADSNAPVMSEADPGARTLSLMSGYDIRSVQSAMVGLIALMFLVGAGLGPYASWSVMDGIGKAQREAIDITPAAYTLTAEPARPEPTPPKSLALPKPDAPEPPGGMAPEWRQLLDDLGIPRKKRLGPLDPKEDKERVGWRWYAWLCANGHTGPITSPKLEDLYGAYARAIHSEQWGYRIAASKLNEVSDKWVSKKDQPSPTTYTITAPNNIAQLRKVLVAKKIIAETTAAPPAAEEAKETSVVPFAKRLFNRASGE